jgi:hypothetical protein
VSRPVVWVGVSPSFAEVVRGEAVSHVKYPGLRDSELELRGLDLLLEAWCRVVEDGRMAVNCYALEQSHRSTEKKRNPICFHGVGEARKKKLWLSRSCKKLLEWLWATLDRVSTSRFNWARLGLKPKHGSWAGTKALMKKSAGLGSSPVASDPEPDSVHAQPETSLVAFLSVSGDSVSRFSSPPCRPGGSSVSRRLW